MVLGLARRVPRVEAFEPNAGLVRRPAPALPGNANLHQVALSDRTGRSTLWIPAHGTGTEGRSSLEIAVMQTEFTSREGTVKRLDDRVFRNPRLRGEHLLTRAWRPIHELDRRRTAEMGDRVAWHGYVANNLFYARDCVRNFLFRPA